MSQHDVEPTSAYTGTTSDAGMDALSPDGFFYTEIDDYGQRGGEEHRTKEQSPDTGPVTFSKENSNMEFKKLNKCIETSMKIGEISVDDAETLVFFLELVKETLTTRRYSNA
jgi:hypothetical protein